MTFRYAVRTPFSAPKFKLHEQLKRISTHVAIHLDKRWHIISAIHQHRRRFQNYLLAALMLIITQWVPFPRIRHHDANCTDYYTFFEV